MKSRQEELLEIQFLKTHYTAEDHRQDSRSSNNNMISHHDRKT